MKYQDLTTKMHEYLDHTVTQSLSKWLERNLPTNETNWWEYFVIAKLSDNQRILVERNGWTRLSQLDLSALLRVANKNWNVIRENSRIFLNQSDRSYLECMFEVRNRWSHCNSEMPSVAVVSSDLDTLVGFLASIGLDYDLRHKIEILKSRVEHEGIVDAPFSLPQTMNTPSPKSAISPISKITIGSMVRLKSDPNTKGAVISIDDLGSIKKYIVFVGNAPKTFFEDQVEVDVAPIGITSVDPTELLRRLTAYQINKPSSESLYSLNSARVDFVPYQFRPALKLIKSDTPRLLIADSVGVGKTIEAGLILKEMQARIPLDSVLIICPKPLVVEHKWETEMKRFDEDFIPVDGQTLRNIIKNCNRDGEWPEHYRRAIIPYSILNEEILMGTETRRNQKGLLQLDPPPMFDMVIVDEAHHIRNSSTQTHKAVKYFVEHANAVLFLTATPLQLGDEDLFTLLNLLYPDIVIDKATFVAMTESNPFINKAISALRQRESNIQIVLEYLNQAAATDWGRSVIAPNPVYKNAAISLQRSNLGREQRIKLMNDIETLHSFANMINRTRRQDIGDFCVRRATTLQSEFTEQQRKLHDALLEFEAEFLRAMHGPMPLKFLMTTISRQAASCIFGLAPSIKSFIYKRISELTDDYDLPDDFDLDNLNIGDFADKAQALIGIAEELPEDDPKFDALSKILIEKQKDKNNKVIIFSSFRHTLRYLEKKIREECRLRVAQIHGAVNDEERYQLRERFVLPRASEKAIDVLLFTEVGSEGLDYQFCANIVNYDLPWNPMRIEQRIGRLDRRGQQSDVVQIYNCVTGGTIDADIFERCLLRIGVFEHSIGDCEEILGDIANSINKIVFDTKLTNEERAVKLEHLADNEVRHIQELQQLENEEKQMFGLDISNFTDDIDKADNPWLSAPSVKRLVEGYLSVRLGAEKSYITGNTLRLSADAKIKLMEDCKTINAQAIDKKWTNFLKSGAQTCRIAFEQDIAEKDLKTIFITAMHPLARQAAAKFANGNQVQASLTIYSSDVAAGTYPFLLYLWEYTGNRPQVNIVAICDNEGVCSELMTLLQSAVQSSINDENFSEVWNKLEEKHYEEWQIKRKVFREEAQSLCRFKLESLTKSVAARRNIYNQRLENNTDEKVNIMLNAAIQNLESYFERKKEQLEQNAELADIHTTLIVCGVLKVEEK